VTKTDALDILGVCFLATAAGLVDPRLALVVVGVAFLLISWRASA
jgi:hypothetical protein